MSDNPSKDQDLCGEDLEKKRLALEIREREWTLSGWGKLVKLGPLITIALGAISLAGSTYWYVNQERRESERLLQEAITKIKKEFVSEDPEIRIAAAAGLAAYPKVAIPLLTSTSTLGRVDPDTGEEDTAFTSAVRDSLRQIGEASIRPLLRNLRLNQTEIDDMIPRKLHSGFRRSILSYFLHWRSFKVPREELTANLKRELDSANPKLSEEEIEATLRRLFQSSTLERRSASKNAQQILATLLQTYRFDNVNLANTYLSGSFPGVYLRKANLSNVHVSDADFSEADLQTADLSRADLSGANLSKADLSYANLSDANLNITRLPKANLFGANVSEVMGDGADLSGADLSNANLSGGRLFDVNFSNANLENADLTRASLKGANLSNANLTKAQLLHTCLRSADLSGIVGFRAVSDLRWTNLKDVVGLPTPDREYAISRGAEVRERLAEDLKALPPGLEFPGELGSKISYDESSSVLIWDGEMSREEYKKLRGLSEDVSYGNAVFSLNRRAWRCD